MIAAGKRATPISLKTEFERHPPIRHDLTVPQYLGTLAANATTIINAEDYGRLIVDLATRRALVVIGTDIVNEAYEAGLHVPPDEQIAATEQSLKQLSHENRHTIDLTSLAEVQAVSVDWLWHRRIARGKLALIAGQPGRGKSQLSLYFAARVSTGSDWPDGAPCPLGSVVLVCCEDDESDTIVPRLIAAGADRARCFIHALTDLGKDVPRLAAKIKAIGDVALVVIDPVSAYLGKIDGNNAPEVRRSLAPLLQMAAEANVAVLLVTHPNKSTSQSEPMARVSGSGAFVAVCRSAWLVEKDPQDAEGKRRVLAPLKNNIGDDITGFVFRVDGALVENGIETSRVVFEPGTVTISAAELLQGQGQTSEDRGALDEAEEFLLTFLKNAPVATKAVQKAAKDAGIAQRTLERARARLKVHSTKSKDTGNWLLALPAAGCAEQLRQDRHLRHVSEGEEVGGVAPLPSANHEDRQPDPPSGGGGVGGDGGALRRSAATRAHEKQLTPEIRNRVVHMPSPNSTGARDHGRSAHCYLTTLNSVLLREIGKVRDPRLLADPGLMGA